MRGRRPSPLDDSGAFLRVEASKALGASQRRGPAPTLEHGRRAILVRRRAPCAIFALTTRGCGGIGRRARFRSVSGKPGGGSSPLIRIARRPCKWRLSVRSLSPRDSASLYVQLVAEGRTSRSGPPRDSGGIATTGLALNASQPAGGHKSTNTHATSASGRAALGARRPAHPSRLDCSPTRWNAGHGALVGRRHGQRNVAQSLAIAEIGRPGRRCQQ